MKEFEILISEPKAPYKKKDGQMSKNAFNYYFQDEDTQSVFTVYETGDIARKVGDLVDLQLVQYQGKFSYKFSN
jgi:hypothetical protein